MLWYGCSPIKYGTNPLATSLSSLIPHVQPHKEAKTLERSQKTLSIPRCDPPPPISPIPTCNCETKKMGEKVGIRANFPPFSCLSRTPTSYLPTPKYLRNIRNCMQSGSIRNATMHTSTYCFPTRRTHTHKYFARKYTTKRE